MKNSLIMPCPVAKLSKGVGSTIFIYKKRSISEQLMERLTKGLKLREIGFFFTMILLLNASSKHVGSIGTGSNIKICNFFHKMTIIQFRVLCMVESVLFQKGLFLAKKVGQVKVFAGVRSSPFNTVVLHP